MLLLTIDETSRTPRFRQIIEQILDRIARRILRPGELLPSTRRLAAELGIHRATVAAAYQELWAAGVLDLRAGARPRVRHRPQIESEAGRRTKGILNWTAIASPAANGLCQAESAFNDKAVPAPEFDFSRIDIDPRLFPLDQFRACLSRTVRKRGGALLRYGDRAGFLPFREHLAGRLRAHGIAAGAEEILVTNGSQHGLDLVLRMIAAAGRNVVVESPTYDYLLPLIRFHGLHPLEVPMAPGGIDLGLLAAAIRKRRPVLVHTMPNFHNPTGITTTQAHREELLALCESGGVPLVEDGFEEEMKYFGKVVLPIKSMDRRHVVIYCGTLSKVLFPGLRIGWLVAERGCIERLTAIRRFSELSPNMLLQSAVLEFYESGAYDRHVSRMHRVFRRRMQAAIHALRAHIPEGLVQWDEPSGGFLIWLKLPVASAGRDWPSLFASHGVNAAFGNRFFASGSGESHVRLSIASLDEAQITDGIRRISAALRQGQRPVNRRRTQT